MQEQNASWCTYTDEVSPDTLNIASSFVSLATLSAQAYEK